jgi:cell division protein FtsB
MPVTEDTSGRVAKAVVSVTGKGVKLTWHVVAVLGVLVVLMFSYASSLHVYFGQQAAIAASEAQVQANQQAIDDLHNQLNRWKDPAYVEAQARDRLGWVIPGEIGFQVIGPDGQPLGVGAGIGSVSGLPAGELPQTWWNRLVGSIQAADNPAPAPDTTTQGPITVDTTPSPAPTSSPS